MRPRALMSLSVLIMACLATTARAQEHSWVVLSNQVLDDRIERQLNVLAAHDQALIRIQNSNAEKSSAAPEAGGLIIELRQEKNVDTFLASLKQAVNATGFAPTAVLAPEGYIIEADYPRAAAPDPRAAAR